MVRRHFFVLALILALLSRGALGAEPPEEAKEGAKEEAKIEAGAENEAPSAVLEQIEIRSANRREELKSTSATILENKDMSDRIYPSPLYFLRQTPGVRISEFSEQGVASTVNIRGFGGGHGGEVSFYMDGIPLNDGGHADNYSDTTVIIPLEMESLEVIKGPASVLYGGRGSSGGVAAFQSIKEGTFNRYQLRYGSHNSIDAQGIIAYDDGPLHHVYAFQGYHTDGWRKSNSEWNRYNLSGRWTYDVNKQLKVSLNLRAAIAEWDAADRVPSWSKPDKVFVDDGSGEGNMNGGHRDRYDARLWASYLLTDEQQLTFYAFGSFLDNNMAEMTPKGPNPGDVRLPGEISGNDQTNRRRAYGVGLVYNYKNQDEGALKLSSVTLGFDFLRENEHRQLYRLIWGSGNSHGAQYGDTEYGMDTWSAYTEGVYQLLDSLKVRAAVRYDHFASDIDTGPNHTQWGTPNTHYKAAGRGEFSPKFGLVFTPLENLDLYANYGRGYAMPGISNGNFFTLDNLKLAKRDQYEIGFRYSPTSWVDFGSTLYLIDTTNDFHSFLNPGTGQVESQNAGKTQRKGIENYVKFYPVEHLTLAANYTYQEAEYKKRPDAPELEGRRFTGIPRHIFNLEAAYAPPKGLGGRAVFNWNADIVGRDDPRPYTANPNIRNPYKSEDYGTLDLQVNYRFNDRYKLSLDVTNVLDDRPKQGVPNAQGNFLYWPQAPRAVYVMLEGSFF